MHSEYQARINKVIAYIDANLSGDLSLGSRREPPSGAPGRRLESANRGGDGAEEGTTKSLARRSRNRILAADCTDYADGPNLFAANDANYAKHSGHPSNPCSPRLKNLLKKQEVTALYYKRHKS